MKNIIYSILIIVTFCGSCTKTDPLSNYAPRAVVEGYLAAGDTIDILIKKEIPFGQDSTTTAEPINNLVVTLETEGKTIALTSVDSGHYVSSTRIIAEKTYKLKFDYNGKTITATTTIPPKPKDFKMSASEVTITPFTPGGGVRPTFPDPVKLTWTNSDQTFYLTAFKNLETSPESIFGGIINFGGRNRPPLFNRPTQTNGAEIEPPRLQYYGNFDVYLMHVQPEYAALYEENGNSSLNLTPPPTNIDNGLGIFTGFAADTLRLYVKKP
ncbi:MAG: DUF4249 family protein [Saprospiraceae bacterium]|nr:DUF4249 family protein [Saprospiraceae bacterium]